ncbi:MAG: VanW family protein [Patescibacteria group bacterium]
MLSLKKIIKQRDDGKIDKQWLFLIIIAAVFIIFLISAVAVMAFEIRYEKKFFPGSKIGNISLEGLTTVEALDTLDKITQNITSQGIKVVYHQAGKEIFLDITNPIDALADPDLSREIFSFDNHRTIYQAFPFARQDNWFKNLLRQKSLFLSGKQFEAQFNLDEETLKKLLKQRFSQFEKPAQNAKPVVSFSGGDYNLEITGDEAGVSLDYGQAIGQLKDNLKKLDNQPVELKGIIEKPTVEKKDVLDKSYLVEKILNLKQPQLTESGQTWEIGKNSLSAMLEFQKLDGQITVGLSRDSFLAWLEKNVIPKVNVAPVDAKLQMKGGKITEFSAHRDGKEINVEQTFNDLNNNLLLGKNPTEISVKSIQPKIATGSINDLGIKEIIGVGQSSFAGSPNNRRHNIKNGAQKLHGILIKPTEEFSLINALGDVDAATGYLPELVIKENKTTPEYGGGLCQIGTTVFRAALASGLPITERRNHSYNVTYYLENGLPGTDATIYIPHPDVRFVNDTGNYILIQSRLSGDNLYFEFWGTKDGRSASRTTPKVWGWVSPAATKYIETTDLKPGAKKCTENSHKGVNASFDYTVIYPSGEKKETNFTSHYKPWQAVCLIGVEKLSGDTTNGDGTTATSTPVTP